jgi:hypothetical protein
MQRFSHAPYSEAKSNPRSPQNRKSPTQGRFLKILTRIGLVLLLLVPTYLAVIGYFLVKNAPTNTVETYYTGLEITGPSGYVVSAAPEHAESEKAALFECFRLMLSDAVYTPGIPDTHVGRYTVTMLTNTDPEKYTFHFAPTDGAAYYTDAAGITRRTADNSAEYFLNSPFSFELYAESTPPVLTTAATDEIIPTELSWSYRTEDGTFSELTRINTTQDILTYPIANDVAFYFSLEPSSCTLSIRDGDSLLHSGGLSNISLPQLTQGKVLDFEIEASYGQDSRYNYYGHALYRFRMSVVEAASFSLDVTAGTLGDYFMLTCHNVRNENKLVITASPALTSTPIIFKRGETVYAAIPADTVGERRLTATYGTVSKSFDLTIGERADATDHPFAEEALRGDWSTVLDSALAGRIETLGATADSGLFTPLEFALPSASATPTMRFGDTLTIGDAESSRLLPFELYEASGAVLAMSGGRVLEICKNENDPLGKYVIIDHGAGLYTWYCGLSDVKVERGAYVRVGQAIGTAGKTGIGLSDKDGFMVLATFGKTAIDPQALRK